jgi:hypothetical protein
MKTSDYIKASRKGSREAELENENGFKAVLKVHKSQKTYTRKPKYKENYCNIYN